MQPRTPDGTTRMPNMITIPIIGTLRKIALKRRVHDLIKAGALAFDDEDVPDVNKNPLPDHQRPKINAVESDPELLVEKDARVVRMSMKTMYDALLKARMLEEEQEKKVEKQD